MHAPGEATVHALSLHEIRTHIAQFLSLRDITKAIRVCRQWNDFFHPFLFNDVKISSYRRNPPLDVLQKYAQYIHRLEFDMLPAGRHVLTLLEYFFLQGCSSLTRLAYTIKTVSHYRVSEMLERNIKIPMELYDPNENAEDPEDSDTGFGLFDDLDPVIATEQNPSQPLKSAGFHPREKVKAMLDPWELARYFVSIHASSLREITLTGSTPTLAFWETLARDCSMTLESLTLAIPQIDERVETAFWMACRNLISLNLECKFLYCASCVFCDRNEPSLHVKSAFFPWPDKNRSHFFPRMKNIMIKVPQIHPLFELLRNSPNLESLGLTLVGWNIVSVLKILATIAGFDLHSSASPLLSSSTLVRHTTTMSTGKTWEPLHSMSIDCRDISDQQLSALLRFATTVVNVVACDTEFGDETMQTMREHSHFRTLREMDLTGCCNVTSKMVNTLLVSCPALEALSAGILYVVDMTQDGSQPWVCLNMQYLRLNIDLFDPYQEDIESAKSDVLEREGSESYKEINEAEEARKSKETLQIAERQRLIIAQLAKLRKLKVLYASHWYSDSNICGPKEYVEFILEKGLGQLARLTQLREIYFDSSNTPCLPEAEWMLKNWKQLRVVCNGLYMVNLDKPSHDLRAMFAAPKGVHLDAKLFDTFP